MHFTFGSLPFGRSGSRPGITNLVILSNEIQHSSEDKMDIATPSSTAGLVSSYNGNEYMSTYYTQQSSRHKPGRTNTGDEDDADTLQGEYRRKECAAPIQC